MNVTRFLRAWSHHGMRRRFSCIPPVPPVKYDKSYMDSLRLLPNAEFMQLPNGVTVTTDHRCDSLHTCVTIGFDAGSRHEDFYDNGIAHFLTHLTFNGTAIRADKKAVTYEMFRMGAHFRTFVDREMVWHYVSCLNEHVPALIEFLGDCIFNNTFRNIEEHRQIVYEEVQKLDNNPTAVLFDYLHASAYMDTPMGRSVEGPSTNICSFTESMLNTYRSKFFTSQRMVLASVGGVAHDQIVNIASKTFGKLPSIRSCDNTMYRFTGSDIRFRNDDMPLMNVAIAFEGPCFYHPDTLAMDLAVKLVGGWHISYPGEYNAHILARACCVAKLAVAYEAFNLKYIDGSLWGIQFLAHRLFPDELLVNIHNRWMELCTCVTETELNRAKRELKNDLISRYTNFVKTSGELARYSLYVGYLDPLASRLNAIDALSVDSFRTTLDKYLYNKCPAVAAVGPVEALPEYNRIRSGQYWLRV